jgi:hypothetical protein
MAEYTRCKTVRFEPKTWALIESDAAAGGVTTSEYIRDIIVEAVADVEVSA